MGEIVFKAEDDALKAPDDIKLWMMLDHIATLASVSHPALTSLLQSSVLELANQRNAIFRWCEEGLERVDYDDKLIKSLTTFSAISIKVESDQRENSEASANGIGEGDSES